MSAVDQIIERELLGGRTISIPFVGSLRVVRYGAKAEDDRGMIAPWRSVWLDENFDDNRSLINVLAHELFDGDELRATDHYNSWLTSATVGRLLIIHGVGSVSLDDFTLTLDPSIEFRLRPAGVNPLSIGRAMLKEPRVAVAAHAVPRGIGPLSRGMVVSAVLLMIAAAGYFGYYIYLRNCLNFLEK